MFNKTKFLFSFIFIVAILVAGLICSLDNFNQPTRAGFNDNISGYAWSGYIGWLSFNSANSAAPESTFSTSTDYGVSIDTSTGKLSGYAWSGYIGWLSFNSVSDNSPVDYGVNINTSTGKFSGYAWSENIGWISFNRNDTGAPPSDDPCPDGSCIAKIDNPSDLGSSDVNVIGWARALSYGDGWDGWIRFDHGQSSNNDVYIDSSGNFHGWAWSNAVVGWISFCGKIVSQTCSDGTLYGQCSLEKPKYCDNGKLVNKCNVCGCPSGYSCQEDGSCAIVSQCIGDINNDGEINIYDLAILISHWGQENTADLNNDNIVDLEDVKILLTHWGEICGNQCQVQGDVDNNGEINCDDLDCVLGVILGEKSLEECPCSDVNRDEKINQLDVSKEIDILLSKGIECGKCKQCSDCGDGLFNVCDRQECLSCQENCYFIDKTIGGDCLSCSNASSCQDYQNDETTCQTDPCGFGNCKWENNKCISE